MPKEEKVKILKVTITQHYLIPMLDGKRTKINGWDMEQVIQDWFVDHPIYMGHVTRNGHLIGNSEKVIDITKMSPEDTEFWKDGE